MEIALAALSWICLLTGVVFCLLGSIGLLRFPDVFARTHSTGLIDTMGAGLILFGLLLQAPTIGVAIKLLFIAVFIWITSPTATHALAQSAYAHGLEPMLGDAPNPLKHETSDLSPETEND